MSPRNDITNTTKAKAKPKAKPKTPARAKRGAGRPKAIIPWDKVDAYLKAGCTGTGIAGMLGIHPNTLYEACTRDHKCDFSEYSQTLRAVGDDLLRAKQFDVAMKGSEQMLKFLGKNRLGQRERPKEVDDDTPKRIEFVVTEEMIEPKDGRKEDDEAGA